MNKPRMPALNALRAFEAAARQSLPGGRGFEGRSAGPSLRADDAWRVGLVRRHSPQAAPASGDRERSAMASRAARRPGFHSNGGFSDRSAAVDEQGLPGYVAGILRHHEGNRSGDLLRPGQSPHRDVLEEDTLGLAASGRGAAKHFRLDACPRKSPGAVGSPARAK